MAHSIALVDDDKNILASVHVALEAEGFSVRTYADGEEALYGLTQQPADVAVLDIKMPRMDGIELLQKLKQSDATRAMPIIFLTSKDEEEDELMGLRLGADDYIKKPFSLPLLIERIRVLLRRDAMPSDVVTRGDLTVDSTRHVCLWKGEIVGLTVTEFLLVKALAFHPGHVKTRDQLMDAAYGEAVCVDDRTIDSHVKRLRKKFKDVDPAFSQIDTLYGVGYRYKE